MILLPTTRTRRPARCCCGGPSAAPSWPLEGFAKGTTSSADQGPDLDEDYDIDLDEAEAALEGAEGPDPSKVLGKVTKLMLQDIADELMD
jgi:hypothetical protein